MGHIASLKKQSMLPVDEGTFDIFDFCSPIVPSVDTWKDFRKLLMLLKQKSYGIFSRNIQF